MVKGPLALACVRQQGNQGIAHELPMTWYLLLDRYPVYPE